MPGWAKLLVGVLVIAGAGISWYAYQFITATAGSSSPTPVSQGTETPSAGIVTAEGTILPSKRATLAFKIGGRVSHVRAQEGDPVGVGAILVQLDDSAQQTQVRQAIAAVTLAQRQLAQLEAGGSETERQAAQDAVDAAQAKYDEAQKNAGDLAKKDAAAGLSQAKVALARLDPSPEAIAVAQAQVGQAQAALDTARSAQYETVLKAPFAATLAEVNVNVGDFVGPGMPVVTLGDLSKLSVESSDISDLDIQHVQAGQKVNIRVDAQPGKVFHGIVARISPMAVESRGYKVFRVWVDLEEGTADGLRWGMDARLEIRANTP